MKKVLLKPFTAGSSSIDEIEAAFDFSGSTINVSFHLKGDLSGIVLPSEKAFRERRDELWKSTCFECFIAANEDNSYYEYNVAPTGDWNVYRFTRYREGMSPAALCQPVISKLFRHEDDKQAEVILSLPKPATLDGIKCFNITAVIESTSGKIQYWAIDHPSSPDFHDKSCYVIA